MSALTLLPPRRYRWNYTVMGLDISLFVLAISFASSYGLLPLFVRNLTDSNLAVGAITTLRALNLLAPIFVAGLTERLQRKQPFILWVTVFERVPYLVLAIATPIFAASHPSTLLWLFYAMYALTMLAAGIASPAWLDLIARMIPDDWRGRFFGMASALGGLLGVVGSAGAAALLLRFDWIIGIAFCFLIAFVLLVVSFFCLVLGREPLAAATARKQEGTPWRRLPAILRTDHNLRRYLGALLLITAASPTAAFFVIDAKGALALSNGEAGLYATVLLAASTVGNLLWGYVGDHIWHKRVLIAGALCTGLAPLLALLVRDPAWGGFGYALVFMLTGLATSALQLTALTFIIDLAPATQRPTYIGLANAAQAPIAIGAPLLGAALADARGYPALFVLTAVLALSGAALIARAVRDPRKQGEPRLVTEAS